MAALAKGLHPSDKGVHLEVRSGGVPLGVARAITLSSAKRGGWQPTCSAEQVQLRREEMARGATLEAHGLDEAELRSLCARRRQRRGQGREEQLAEGSSGDENCGDP